MAVVFTVVSSGTGREPGTEEEFDKCVPNAHFHFNLYFFPMQEIQLEIKNYPLKKTSPQAQYTTVLEVPITIKKAILKGK